MVHVRGGGPILISLWVRPPFRGQGIGRLLVGKVVKWARAQRTRQVALWVTEGNERALSLYIDIGFRDTGEHQVHPSHPDFTEKRMVLEL
jgi:ribosomal-protein-alanine N-acetyltransferase